MVKALQDRSLVDCQDGEYWLHPVIRGEAIGRLKESVDWETINQKVAEFWIARFDNIETELRESETIEGKSTKRIWLVIESGKGVRMEDTVLRDGAWVGKRGDPKHIFFKEAYYHCLVVEDFGSAAAFAITRLGKIPIF